MSTSIYDLIIDVSKIDLPLINEFLSFVPIENIDKDIIASNLWYILNQQDEKVNKEYVVKERENVRKQIKQIEYEQLKEIYIKIVNLIPFRQIYLKNLFCDNFYDDILTKFIYEFIQNDFKNDTETFAILMSNMMMNMMEKSNQELVDILPKQTAYNFQTE